MKCDHPRHPDCGTDHKRIALERKVLRYALAMLREDGWNVYAVHDGEERYDARTVLDVLTVVFSVDISTVCVRRGKYRSWFSVVLGNGIDCIPDYGMRIDPVMARVYDHITGWE